MGSWDCSVFLISRSVEVMQSGHSLEYMFLWRVDYSNSLTWSVELFIVRIRPGESHQEDILDNSILHTDLKCYMLMCLHLFSKSFPLMVNINVLSFSVLLAMIEVGTCQVLLLQYSQEGKQLRCIKLWTWSWSSAVLWSSVKINLLCRSRRCSLQADASLCSSVWLKWMILSLRRFRATWAQNRTAVVYVLQTSEGRHRSLWSEERDQSWIRPEAHKET